LYESPESTNLGSKTAVEVVESVKSGGLRVLRRWDEWLRDYRPWLVPDSPKVLAYSDDMDEPCACARCGKRVTYGECYTSMQIHTYFGIGYAVCPKCHELEFAERAAAEKVRRAAAEEARRHGQET
jgi:hypothetical protein